MSKPSLTELPNPVQAVPPSEVELAPRLRLAITRLGRRLRRQADLPGVSPTQISALATVERAGPVTLGELATLEGVRPPTITAAIARMEEDGLVVRTVDERDRRINRVAVSPAGAKLLAKSRSRKNAYLERQLRELPGEDRAVLARAASILEALLEDDPR